MAKTRVSNGNLKHNNREIDVFLIDHIDEKRTKENLYWTIYDTEEKRCGFDDEASFILENLEKHLSNKMRNIEQMDNTKELKL